MDVNQFSASATRITMFRYWCQKVLPAVYDDSLSYYELLNKVVEYLNEVIKVSNAHSEAIEEILKWIDKVDNDIEEYVKHVIMTDPDIQQTVHDTVEEYMDGLLRGTTYGQIKDNGFFFKER